MSVGIDIESSLRKDMIATPRPLRHQARPHRRESNGSLAEIEWRRELGL